MYGMVGKGMCVFPFAWAKRKKGKKKLTGGGMEESEKGEIVDSEETEHKSPGNS